jgi:hypothetical protein
LAGSKPSIGEYLAEDASIKYLTRDSSIATFHMNSSVEISDPSRFNKSLSRKESLGCLDLKKIGIDPIKEHFRIKEKLEFPMNPAF